jgi:hypothetical protein
MKLLQLSCTGLLALAFFSCQKESSSSAANELSTMARKPTGTTNANCYDYNVNLSVDYTSEPGHSIFTWSIQNPAPGNGSNGTLQNLSHWDFVPSDCLDDNWQDVLSASYNQGAGWVAITPLPTIEPDPSLVKFGCTSGDVFKFDQGTTGSAITQYRIVMNGHWGTGDMTVFFKSGTNTGCCTKTITAGGIGCPEDESCSFSQGYWFANNDMHPEGVHPWGTTVTIGGYTYTNAEGLAIWNASNVNGIKDAKKAFTQLAAIRLSGVDETDPELAAAVATIEAWLSIYGAKLTDANLRNQSAAEILAYGNAKAAADVISQWINANHCQ